MRKLLTIMIAITMVISISTTAFAQDDVSSTQEGENFDGIYQELPTENVDIEDLTVGSDMPDNTEMDLSGSSLSESTELLGKTRAATQSWTGTIANEGEMTYVFATLETDQIVNATLECPQNADLDYDLFIYDIDATGTLGKLRSASTTQTYINARVGKTVDEGAAYINRSSQTQDYAIIVFATKGGSAYDTFKLTVSAAGARTYDGAEPNDSPFTAYNVALGTTIDGPSLHVVNDQDWYVMSVDETYSAARINAVTTTGEYKVELYQAEDAKMIKKNMRSDSAYTISPGVYFIRVFKNNSGFSAQPYTLNVIALNYARESTIEFSQFVPSSGMGEFQYIGCPAQFVLEVEVTTYANYIGFSVSESNAPGSNIYQEYLHIPDGKLTFSTEQLMLKYGMSGVYVWFYDDRYSSDVPVTAKVRSKYSPVG